MKWYSAKEHRPILSNCCVLLAVHQQETGNIHLTLGQWDNDDGWLDWYTEDSIEKEFGHKVIYYCYPDPIPKAYESLIESQEKIRPTCSKCGGYHGMYGNQLGQCRDLQATGFDMASVYDVARGDRNG